MLPKHLWKLLLTSPGLSWCHRRWLWCHLHPCMQRFSALNIQMLTGTLHKQVFPAEEAGRNPQSPSSISSPSQPPPPLSPSSSPSSSTRVGQKDLARIQAHLQKFGLLKGSTEAVADVHLELPRLFGQNVDEHFRHIASEQTHEYKSMAESIAVSAPPPLPSEWVRQKGWTKYKADGTWESVLFPDEEVLVFDIECLMQEGNFPTMATALSPTHW